MRQVKKHVGMRGLAAVAAVTALLAGPLVTGVSAAPTDRAVAMIEKHTGKPATALGAAGVSVAEGAHVFRPAVDRRTWVQTDGDDIRLIAELTRGESTVLFPDIAPEGFTIRLNADGSATVLDVDGHEAGTVERPWAYDASGTRLPTHYVVRGRGLEQVVSTDGAVYPIIADPWVTSGWYYTTAVHYIEMSWSETWKLKNALDSDWSNAPALLCGYLPRTASIACAAYWLGYRQDVKNTVNAAIANRKCYKVRMPLYGPGGAYFWAYDSYYKTCRA
jgi:hypothetical protein